MVFSGTTHLSISLFLIISLPVFLASHSTFTRPYIACLQLPAPRLPHLSLSLSLLSVFFTGVDLLLPDAGLAFHVAAPAHLAVA